MGVCGLALKAGGGLLVFMKEALKRRFEELRHTVGVAELPGTFTNEFLSSYMGKNGSVLAELASIH